MVDTKNSKKLFLSLRETLETDMFKMLFDIIVKEVPEYFWSVPASSTGHHHPDYALGNGGLVRHVYAATKILNDLLALEYNQNKYGLFDREHMRIAIMFHDCMKSGTQTEYEENPHTKFEHPYLASNLVWKIMSQLHFSTDAIYDTCSCIAAHMGQWNEVSYSDITLFKPSNDMEQLVHEADFLASRTFLNFDIEKKIEEEEDEKRRKAAQNQ